MIKMFTILLVSAIILFSKEKTAEELVATKKRADITYRQLMEIMGTASNMIHEGIVRENKQMVKEGTNMIINHPAPKHKPWTIMIKSDQKYFKQSLLAFDKILDNYANQVANEAEKEDWIASAKAAQELTLSCISCHSMWKNKT